MTRSCGVPVLCRIRIAASQVQMGRPSWEGSHFLEDAISERKAIPWAGLFQRGIGPGVRDGPTARMGQSVQTELRAAPRLTAREDPQAGPETQLNSGTRAKSETQLQAGTPCRGGERRGVRCKSASREPKPGREPRPSWTIRTAANNGAEPGTTGRTGKYRPSREIQAEPANTGRAWESSRSLEIKAEPGKQCGAEKSRLRQKNEVERPFRPTLETRVAVESPLSPGRCPGGIDSRRPRTGRPG
jgi:hypothetical protein